METEESAVDPSVSKQLPPVPSTRPPFKHHHIDENSPLLIKIFETNDYE